MDKRKIVILYIFPLIIFSINASSQSTGTEERYPKGLVKQLKDRGFNTIIFHESQGTAHEWLTWRRALNEFAPKLFK